MTNSHPQTEKVRQLLDENPSIMLSELANQLTMKEEEVVHSLPANMAVEVPAEEFDSLWERMTGWEKVTFLCISSGCVTEISGPLPKGKRGHGMFNLHEKGNPLGGHLLVGNLSSIWLVSKPVFGKESHSVLFYDNNGDAMFSVYLGRDSKRNIIESIKADYLLLRQQYENQ